MSCTAAFICNLEDGKKSHCSQRGWGAQEKPTKSKRYLKNHGDEDESHHFPILLNKDVNSKQTVPPHLHILIVGSVMILHTPPSVFPPDALVSFHIRAPEVDIVGARAAPSSIQLPPQVVVLPLQVPQLSLDIKCGGVSLSSGVQRSPVLAAQAGCASRFQVFVFVGVR